jgi:hypothetical protein
MPQDIFPPSSSSGGLTDAELRASAVPVSLASAPLPTGAATDTVVGTLLTAGTDISGASMPSGGSGGMGWLSAIWKALTDRLPSSLVSGRLDVNVGNTPAVTFSGDVTVVGKAAHDAAASGNPVLVGGRYASVAPSVADGDATTVLTDSAGRVYVTGTVLSSPIGTHEVGGPVAHDGAYSGNPLPLGAYASASAPTAVTADGDVVRLWSDRNGRLQVGADTELPAAASLADGASNPTAPMVGANALLWNGSTWDRRQGKETGTLLALGNYTATQNLIGSAVTSRTARGAIIYVYVETPGTSTLQLNLCAMDPVGFGAVVGAVNVTAAAALYLASWCPGASGTGLGVLLTVAHPLPRRWYLVLNKGDASTWRYAVHYELVP